MNTYAHDRRAKPYFESSLLRIFLYGSIAVPCIAIISVFGFTGNFLYLIVILVVLGVSVGYFLTRRTSKVEKLLLQDNKIGQDYLVYYCTPIYGMISRIMTVDRDKLSVWTFRQKLILQIPLADIESIELALAIQLVQTKLILKDGNSLRMQVTGLAHHTILDQATLSRFLKGESAPENPLAPTIEVAANTPTTDSIKASGDFAYFLYLTNKPFKTNMALASPARVLMWGTLLWIFVPMILLFIYVRIAMLVFT